MGEMHEKMYYSISEVCGETGLEQHVLRYWETEFPNLKPKKNRAGNRAYRRKDIELIKRIKYLLYEKQFTIQGAKKVLSGHQTEALAENGGSDWIEKSKVQGRIAEIRDGLKSIQKDIEAAQSEL